MKRVVFLILLVAVAFWIMARRAREEHARMRFEHMVDAPWSGPHAGHGHGSGRTVAASDEHVKKTLSEAKAALAKARQEVQTALGEARHEVQTAVAKAQQALAAASQDRRGIRAEKIAANAEDPRRENVEGIPVPVVPGTRVTDAVAQPPAPPSPVAARGPSLDSQPVVVRAATPAPGQPQINTRSVSGRISATEERARNDAYLMLASDVRKWLDPEVPQSWQPSAQLLRSLVQKTDIKTVPWRDGPMYVADLTYDSAPARRNSLIETYNRELVLHRMTALGGSLVFILVALGAVSGYIRADEVTKGYYTNRLRLLAAAGVGAAGVIIYQMLG